jgi:hypothetical protein
MRRTEHALLVFSCFILLSGCSRVGSISLQPSGTKSDGSSPSTSGKGSLTLAPGEIDEVYSLKTNLPLGGHIDVTATNGHLLFKPDNSPAHSTTGQSINTRSSFGTVERTPAFVTPQAQEELKRRVPSRWP